MNRTSTHLAVMAALSAALSVGAAHANDEQIMDACIQRFIASDLLGFTGEISIRKQPLHESLPLIAPHTDKIVVTAVDAHGTRLASATCHLDQSAKAVVSLTSNDQSIKLSGATKEVAMVEPGR